MLSVGVVIQSLRAGFSEADVARSLGVPHTTLADFISRNKIREQLAEKSKFEVIDKKYNLLEDSLLDKISQKIRYADINISQLNAVLRTVNAAKRRSMAEGAIPETGNTQVLVQLDLPEHLTLQVRTSVQNEVLEVDGRELTTMPSNQVVKMSSDKMLENNHAKERLDVIGLIPPG